MFTGIIEQVGCITALETFSSGGRVRIDAGPLSRSLELAGSIAVNGCCLTVVEAAGNVFTADLSPETLLCTTFAELKPGTVVNLERPLAAGKPLGGHFVQGHVDGVGRLVHLTPEGQGEAQNWRLAVRLPGEVKRYVAHKGSIAIDGISLTVAGLNEGIAEVAVIPFTYVNTNLRALVPGSGVNLEADILAKYVERLSESPRAPIEGRLSVERLREEGF